MIKKLSQSFLPNSIGKKCRTSGCSDILNIIRDFIKYILFFAYILKQRLEWKSQQICLLKLNEQIYETFGSMAINLD